MCCESVMLTNQPSQCTMAAQDYPSGWGRALSAGTSEDSQIARELMEESEVRGLQV